MFKCIAIFFLAAIISTSAIAQNYEESKVPAYVLPDVLKTVAGKEVRDKKTWEATRRPEILRLFEDNIYGQMPAAFDSIKHKVVLENLRAMGGNARLKEIAITVYKNQKSV